MKTAPIILSLNSGSSTQKCSLYRITDKAEVLLAEGEIERPAREAPGCRSAEASTASRYECHLSRPSGLLHLRLPDPVSPLHEILDYQGNRLFMLFF